MRTHEQIVRKLEQMPGVRSVGVSSSITMDGNDSNDPIFVEDFPPPADKIPPLRRFKWIGAELLPDDGQPDRRGPRDDVDRHLQPGVGGVVSENFAREFWKEPAAALGKRIRQTPNNPWRTIVGVVGDERDDGVAKPAPPIVYWPLLIDNFCDNKLFVQRNLAYAVRTERLGVTDAPQGDPAGGLVRQREPAGRERAHARTDSRRLDGADLVRARDARHRGRRGAAARHRRHLRRHRLRRAAADAGDRHPHGARRRAAGRQRALPAPRARARRHRHRLRHRRRRRS